MTFGVFSEVQRGVSGGVSGVRGLWSGYVGLRHVKTENDELKRQLAAAQIAVQEQRALADRARGLEQLLELRDQLPAEDDRRRDHRRGGDAGFPDGDDRQGHARRPAAPTWR